MISVAEAKHIIKQQISTSVAKKLHISDAMGLQLAQDIVCPVPLPPFHQSAMDGYAFCLETWDKKSPLTIVGEVPAGEVYSGDLLPNSAVRIFTGACLPESADTVVMQEKVNITNNLMVMNDDQLVAGANIRKKGSQTEQGEVAVKAGVRITPATIGYIASMGITEVEAIPTPSVAVIVTGNELIKPGHNLPAGKIYESNSFCLDAVLKEMGIRPQLYYCKDDMNEISSVINQASLQTDILLLTGGISVGDYDFAEPALIKSGYTTAFHKIKQKPGKPLWFGLNKSKPAFALPGNPASVLTCFYEYVVPALFQMMGFTQSDMVKQLLPLSSPYTKKSGLTHFAKGIATQHEVIILSGQESYRMDSFSISDCLVMLPEEATELRQGDLVEVHFIDRLIRNA